MSQDGGHNPKVIHIISTSAGQVRTYHLAPRLETYQDSDIDIDLETSMPPPEPLHEESSVHNSPIRTPSQKGTVTRPLSRLQSQEGDVE